MKREEIIAGLESVKMECGKHLNEGFAWICEPIDEAIEALQTQRTGKWFFSKTDYITKCSACGNGEWKGYVPTPEEATKWMPICPNCGAKMQEGE